MKSSIARLTAGAALIGSTSSIIVTSGSSCSSQCGNVLDATTRSDLVCFDSDLTSSSATVLKNCMNCELTSNYYTTNPNETDQQWLLYNSRYTVSECLWGYPGNNSVSGDSPCVTSRACGALQTALQYGNLSTSTDVAAYGYCGNWSDSVFVEGCINCLRSMSQSFMANMISMLQVGCDQKPAAGSTISIDGSIFSKTLMNETTPTPSSTWASLNSHGPLSLGAEVGIAIGGLCFILAVAGFCIVCNGRRRRRAFLRKLEMRHKDSSGWPHPSIAGGGGGGSNGGAGVVGAMIHRGADMNETPLSQKPLRGWDDSPQSATASEPSYARYFSPYSSQFNSPVSASDTPGSMMMAQQWPQEFHDHPGGYHHNNNNGFPSASQEKAMMMMMMQQQQQQQQQQNHHDETGTATPPVQIGVALGGDEKSLRTQPSSQSVEKNEQHQQYQHSNNQNVESYELHEVVSPAGSSSAGGDTALLGGHSNSFKNRMARVENRAPVLQHPGYGRYSPDKFPPPPPRAVTGGYRDDEDGGVDNRI